MFSERSEGSPYGLPVFWLIYCSSYWSSPVLLHGGGLHTKGPLHNSKIVTLNSDFNNMATKAQEKNAPVPDWVLSVVGLGVVAWLLYTLPILDILSVFFTFFIIPVLFIACLCIGSLGTFNSISKGWNGGMDQIRQRVAQKVAKAS